MQIDRIKALKDTVDKYVEEEKKRLENEVAVLEDILKSRPGGSGIEKVSVKIVGEAANNDLKTFLEGAK
jgi:hypothetical protein